MNISLEDIIQYLKVNKVNITINKNNIFNELETYKNLEEYNEFDNYINLIEKFKKFKLEKINNNKLYEENRLTKDNKYTYEEKMLLCVASFLDESITLFNNEKIKEHLLSFKKTLIQNLDNYNKAYIKSNFKKYKYSLEDVKKGLEEITEENCDIFLIYISNILEKNIVYKNVIINNNFDKNIEIVESNNKFEIFLKENNYITKLLVNKYKNIDLNKILLNEIRDLSKNLNLEITFYDKNTNKKKFLNKEELIKKILVFIEAHK